MLGNLNGPTLIVILFIVLLLFGAPKLPGLAKSLGQSMKILKKEVSSDGDKDARDSDVKSESSAAPSASAEPSAPSADDSNSNQNPASHNARPDQNAGGSGQ